MGYFFVSLLGYLLGCSNLAYYISKATRKDIRKDGSGNLGASNATILFGWKAGASVAVHDVGKAVLAVILAKGLFPNLEYAGAAAGVAAVLGHIFPFYLRFQGGKGFAPFVGLTFALNWKLGIVIVVLVALITLITDYLALGTFATIVVVPVWEGIESGTLILPLILLIGTAVIFYKHRENFVQLRNGTEIGLRSTAKGEHKVK